MKCPLLLLICFLLTSCGSGRPGGAAAVPAALPADPVPARMDSLKALARPGDLLFRLGDDMVSYSIRFLSEKDPSYSHVGLLVPVNGSLQVAHIGPYDGGRDTLHSEPIDSFLNPAKNLLAGLYRFRISDAERVRFLANVDGWRRRGVHFDYWYDLGTNDKLYCSELIAKSLAPATGNRLQFPGKLLPQSMLKLMYAYFATLSTDTTLIRKRPYISLDQLYTSGHCDSLIKISLRNNP
ncbi:C40 family peptidase [Flaviaesturariibacter terrae]